MAIEVTPLGFKKPDGAELVRGGDNVISDNAANAEALHQDARGRLTLIEAKNLLQDGRLDDVEAKDVAQDADIADARSDATAYTDERDEAYRTVDRALWRSEDDGHQAAAEANAKTYADATFLPAWKAATAYVAAQRVIAPNGDIVAAKVNFTSSTTYNAANWTASTQDARTAVLESSAGLADLITNGTFRNGLTGWTNTGAWVVQTSTNAVTSWARTMSGGDGAFAQSIVVPSRLIGSTLRLKVLAMTTSTGTLITTITTTAGATTQNHTLSTSYAEYTLNVTIPAAQGTTPITLNVGRYTGTVYMTSIRLEAL